MKLSSFFTGWQLMWPRFSPWPTVWWQCQKTASVTLSSTWSSMHSNLMACSEKLGGFPTKRWLYVHFLLQCEVFNLTPEIHVVRDANTFMWVKEGIKTHFFLCRVMWPALIQMPPWQPSASLPCRSHANCVEQPLLWVFDLLYNVFYFCLLFSFDSNKTTKSINRFPFPFVFPRYFLARSYTVLQTVCCHV